MDVLPARPVLSRFRIARSAAIFFRGGRGPRGCPDRFMRRSGPPSRGGTPLPRTLAIRSFPSFRNRPVPQRLAPLEKRSLEASRPQPFWLRREESVCFRNLNVWLARDSELLDAGQ